MFGFDSGKKTAWLGLLSKLGIAKKFPDGQIDEIFVWKKLPEINEILSEEPEKIKNLGWLFLEYNLTPYSIEKSEEIILESVKKLSAKYDIRNIPLVYTTLSLPSSMNFPANVWRELLSTNSFEKNDYGHLEFLDALLDLRKRGVIAINFFEVIGVASESLVFRALIHYLGPAFDKNVSPQGKTFDVPIKNELPIFNEKSGEIILGKKACKIPPGTNQYFLCKKLFIVPFGVRIKEIELLDSIDWRKDTKRSVYDAMRAVNQRVKNEFGIENFLGWRNNHIWINKSLSND